MPERYKERTGRYPARVPVDKIYRNRENLADCKARSIRLNGPALGRPGKDAQLDNQQNYMDGCAHGSGTALLFGEAVPRLGLITAGLRETACHCIAMSILLMNLKKIPCALLAFCQRMLALPCVEKDFVLHSQHDSAVSYDKM